MCILDKIISKYCKYSRNFFISQLQNMINIMLQNRLINIGSKNEAVLNFIGCFIYIYMYVCVCVCVICIPPFCLAV